MHFAGISSNTWKGLTHSECPSAFQTAGMLISSRSPASLRTEEASQIGVCENAVAAAAPSLAPPAPPAGGWAWAPVSPGRPSRDRPKAGRRGGSAEPPGSHGKAEATCVSPGAERGKRAASGRLSPVPAPRKQVGRPETRQPAPSWAPRSCPPGDRGGAQADGRPSGEVALPGAPGRSRRLASGEARL